MLALVGDNLTSGAIDAWSGDTEVSVTQGEASKQPVAVSNAINGHTVARFDGVNDRLALSDNRFSADALPKTLFTVIQSDDFQGHIIGTGAEVMGQFTSQGYALGLAANKPFLKANSSAGGLWLLSPDNLRGRGVQVLSATIANAGAQLRSGCNIASNTTMPMAAPITTAFIGGTHDGAESFAGDIAEILVYNRLLSAAEQTEVWNYLVGKYAVVAAAPEDTDMDGRFDGCDAGAVFLSPRTSASRSRLRQVSREAPPPTSSMPPHPPSSIDTPIHPTSGQRATPACSSICRGCITWRQSIFGTSTPRATIPTAFDLAFTTLLIRCYRKRR